LCARVARRIFRSSPRTTRARAGNPATLAGGPFSPTKIERTVATTDIRAAAKRKTAPARAPRDDKNELMEWLKSIGVAAVLFLVIRCFIIQAYSIPSPSMESTLLVGDFLMANNTVFGARIPFTEVSFPALRDPHRGEIVVFRPTYNHPIEDVVKRVIGIPGDTLQMKDGAVIRNGRRISEPYVQRDGTPDSPIQLTGGVAGDPTVDNARVGYHNHLPALVAGVDRATYQPTRDNWGPVVVPAGHYFMMGDNRDQSLDSRYMGFIPRGVIRGKPLFLYWSVDRQRDAPFPQFITAARWGRIGHPIRACCDR
jgi:signal peptidase I